MEKIEAQRLISEMQRLALQTQSLQIQKTPTNTMFGSALTDALKGVNMEQIKANTLAEQFEMGKTDDLAAVMIAGQKSSIAFQTVLQVRNRLVAAYQDIMNMPI